MPLIPLVPWMQVRPFIPELLLLTTMIGVLLVALIVRRPSNLLLGAVSFAGVALAVFGLLYVSEAGILSGSSSPPNHYLGGLLLLDPFAWLTKLILLIFSLLVIALWGLTTQSKMRQGDAAEFFTLFLGALLGMCLMVSTGHLLMIFVAMEMASLPSYILAGFRKTHRPGAEGALKYVLFGSVISALMLYGLSLVYGYFGTLQLSAIADIARQSTQGGQMAGLAAGALLLGTAFKISAAPAHFWCPDVYEGASMEVAAFLSVASKGAGLALLMRVMILLGEVPALGWLTWAVCLMGVVSCFWGNLAAFRQNHIQRLLAFSSVAHAGYMLLGMTALASPGKGLHVAGAEALLFYLFMYLLMNGGAFVVAAAIEQRTGALHLDEYQGLSRRAPLLAWAMGVFLFSLVGIPPTVGFAAKMKLLLILFGQGQVTSYIALGTLAINTVIGAYFYFRVIRAMFLTPAPETPEVIELVPVTLLAWVLVAANIGFFLAYSWVDSHANSFAIIYRG